MLWNLLVNFLVLFSKEGILRIITFIFKQVFQFRKAWDCDTCIADVQAMASVGMGPEASNAIQAVIQGPAFCEAEDLDLTEEQVATCKQFTEGIGNAFGIIFNYVGQLAPEICVEVYGICEA